MISGLILAALAHIKVVAVKKLINWLKLCLTDTYNVDLNLTLASGQAFRWKFNDIGGDCSNVWSGVLFGHLILLKQSPIPREDGQKVMKCSPIYYSSLPNRNDEKHLKKIEEVLVDYFQLNNQEFNNYSSNSPGWGDVYLKRSVSALNGLRLLRQEPIETLLGFICSSQNNIPRICQMMENLCKSYGSPISNLSINGRTFYTIPKLEELTNEKVEKHLRELGFGYRAKFIVGAAKRVSEKGGDDWLYKLRDSDYSTAQKSLIQLPGVGLKVADCVCIYSLDKTEAVPVDTHIFQIAQRYYAGSKYQLPVIKSKTLSEKQYKILGDCLRKIWCPHAGYAQTFMFSADLRKINLTKDLSDSPVGEVQKRISNGDVLVDIKKKRKKRK